MAQLTTHHDTFDRISAGRSLRFEAPVAGLADLERYASEAIRLYRQDDYTRSEDYSWIDYTVPTSNRAEVDAVLDQMWADANAATPVEVDLVWAGTDLDTGSAPKFVCLPHEQISSYRRPELPWPAARAWLNAKVPGRPGSEVLRTRLRFYHDDLSLASVIDLWELAVAQVALGTESFFVSDGDVWTASQSHIEDIDKLLKPYVVVNSTYLPRYKAGEKEADYNLRASAHGAHFLLDKSMVKLPGQTTFEPCDLLSADGRFMHVKRRTTSSTMSHVITQAVASARLLRGDSGARQKLDSVLKAVRPAPPSVSDMRAHCNSFGGAPTGKVMIVIVGTWRGLPDTVQLPLLTRIALSS